MAKSSYMEKLGHLTPILPEHALFKVEDVAHRYKVSKKTVYWWCNTERIPFLKINGSLRFCPKTLFAWEKSLQHGQGVDENHPWEVLPEGRSVL